MWVKLTDPDDIEFFVNLDRFDRITVIEERGNIFTRISMMLSMTEEDEFYVDAKEPPEQIMKLAGVFVPYHVDEK